ncbi:sensor histidine kinase [Actinorugispora endophytica]|uniref:histidine kinase n=1 Tax=Actinorugispora endophytica TaxID=1605990 RepID=A0A4R6UJC6_9ACTN|nr:nitrate- and nitrite sensing domain-containing protein [Actinorugispora endophytica]TDQ45413.1 signal transduction histidine kinase [Actinorugispora endophytica]
MSESGGTGRGIRSQLNRIVLIPAVTFLVLFAVLSAATVAQAVSLRAAGAEGEHGIRLYAALVELQQERRLALEFLGAPSAEALGVLREQQAATDGALVEADPEDASMTSDFRAALTARGSLREDVASKRADRDDAHARYSALIDLGIGHYAEHSWSFHDGRAVAAGTTVVQVLRVQETFAEADALLAGVAAAGEATGAEQTSFSGLVGELRRRLVEIEPALAAEAAREHADLVESAAWTDMLDTAEQIGAWEPAPPADPDEAVPSTPEALPPAVADWRGDADTVNASLVALADAQARAAVRAIDAASASVFSVAIGGSLLALFAGTLAYGIASRTARRLTNRLSRLRRDTLDLAGSELPEIVRRLERGENVDLRERPRRLDYGHDEIGQVADAFNTAQRTAVAATVKQAEIREGANRVFLALGHRDQSLLQRQLNLLDRIEREEEDPDLLEELFHLDHLATRGRRNAENLIILAGGRPGRRWRHPIPLMDVLRSAISEIEEYPRIKVRPAPEVAVRGEAVADVIHLVAELVENAASYSPPHADVRVHAESVPKGLVVEVEDRGLGIGEDDLAAANETLATAPEFDVMALNEDARLGLFVVARLAAKHGIQVRLRDSPHGGTRAIVLLPAELVVTPPSPPALTPTPERPRDLLDPGSGPFPRTVSRTRTASATGPADPLEPRGGTGADGEERPCDAEEGDLRPSLPRRRRQAHLSPRLRGEPETTPLEIGGAAGARSADETRRMMNALQSGTRLGRRGEPAQAVPE